MTWTGRGLALVTVFFWGAGYVWAQATMQWLPPLAASGLRYGLASVLLLLLAARSGNPFRILAGHWVHYLLLGFIGITCFQAVLFTALHLTSAVSAAVIMALTPALTALGAAVFLGEKLTGRTIAGTAISVAGALLAVLGANPRGLAGFSLNWGDTLALLAAGCMAFYTIAARRLMRHDVPAITNTAVVIAIGTVFLLPLAIPVLPARLPPTAAPLWGLAGVVLGSTVVAYVAWNKAIDLIGATEPGLIYNFIPVITMLLVSLQGDPPWPAQVIGAGVIIFGVTLAMLPAGLPHRHAPGAQPVH